MVEVIQNRKVKSAKKDYECQACLFLTYAGLSDWFVRKMTFNEKREIVLARKDRWKIKAGQSYIYQFNRYDGEAYTFRAREAIHKICMKYDLYPED